MKTIFSILMLAFSMQLFAQNPAKWEPVYVIREFMKTKPGRDDDYLKCEAIWKKAHQKRVAEGNIIAWSLHRLMEPHGTGVQYNYMTITVYKSGKEMEDAAKWTWAQITAGMSKEDLAIMDSTQATRDLVTSKMVKVLERVGDGAKYIEMTEVRAEAGKGNDLKKLEKEMNPVFTSIITGGKLASWRFGEILYPRSELGGTHYRVRSAKTLDELLTWNNNGELDKAFKKTYPAKDPKANWKLFQDIMKVTKVELWETVDQTN